jgi:hypothetical protein
MMSSSDAGNDLCARACPRLGLGARNLPKLARRTEVDLTRVRRQEIADFLAATVAANDHTASDS